jgi:hypothetical protein
MWTFAIPPDVRSRHPFPRTQTDDLVQVIKSRLQGAPEGTYKGFVDCAIKTVKVDGFKALFKGFTPAMARVSPISLPLLRRETDEERLGRPGQRCLLLGCRDVDAGDEQGLLEI